MLQAVSVWGLKQIREQWSMSLSEHTDIQYTVPQHQHTHTHTHFYTHTRLSVSELP